LEALVMNTGVKLASVAALAVLLVVSDRVVGPTATTLMFVALGFVVVTGLLFGRAGRRRSYAAAGVTLLAVLLLAGSVLLIALNNGSDDWIGL
jgi:hypothetical protein